MIKNSNTNSQSGISTSYFFIKTYGCQANKNESERIATYFIKQGLSPTDDWQQASVIVLNTCSVRKAADDRVYALINQIADFFAHHDQSPRVILTGCMSRYGEAKLRRKYPIISEVWAPGKLGFEFAPTRQDKKQAFIQISTGCNSFCTYCVVPYARGRENSRPRADIIAEIKTAIADGFHEVTLLGQNVNSWGLEKSAIAVRKNNFHQQQSSSQSQILPQNADQYHRPTGTPPFVSLIQEISQFPEITKIRFLTSNPWDFHDELIAEIGRNPKIDRYIHLPVQSGSNTVLERMNRGYTREDYLHLVNKLRQTAPDIVLGTDIIVGFCGETEDEFADTLDLVKQVGFALAFVAIYSRRPGTVAAKIYADDIPFAIKKKRFEILDQIINKDQLATRPQVV